MPAPTDASGDRSGYASAIAAYTMWGLLPIYFKLIAHVRPLEIVAHRILWSLALLALLVVLRRSSGMFFETVRTPRKLAALGLCAVLIAANWLIYIQAVQTDHVVAASLGYFLNPLINVVIGVLFLKERLRRVQTIAVIIAAIAVAILAAGELSTLWISLALALTFGFYGLIRKLTPVRPVVGLTVETMLLALPAGALLLWLGKAAPLSFTQDTGTAALLIASGVITAIPLLLFAAAAQRLSLTTLGLLQYVGPSLQFLLGVFVYGEIMSGERWATFLLIWSALALFAWDSVRAARDGRQALTA